MTKRQMLVAISLGVLIYLAMSAWIPSVLSEARQMMCDEGSLQAELCTPESKP